MQLFSSAYNVWPADEAERAEFISGLLQREWLGGLELGYFETVAWPEGVPADLPAIVTGVPGTTGRNAADPDFGLASPDAAGRERALEWARKAADDVAALIADGHPIKAMQLHSAPTGKADRDSFAASLRELAGLDWGGAQLWIEHCDAAVDDHAPVKGYLSLDDEIAVLDELAAELPDAGWGLVINWARSAIEGRDAATPLAHIKQAAESGWLRHIGFSSCSGEVTDFGPEWDDQHLPLAGTAAAPPGSLLGAREVADAIAAGGDVSLGLKVSFRPKDQSAVAKLADLDEQVAVIRGSTVG